MKTITHPTPKKFALAISAIAAADHGICSEVEDGEGGEATVVFENEKRVKVVHGPLQDKYDL